MQEQELPNIVTPLEGVYDPSGVLLSVIVAIAASYVAFSMVRRLLITEGSSRWYWHLGAAMTLGIGIWTMHFIGMIALQLPFPVQYQKGLTFLSVLMSIIGSFIALYIVVIHDRVWQRFTLGALLWASAIAAMHFIGMAAMVMPARMLYGAEFIVLSIVISVGAAGLALYLLCREAKLGLIAPWRRWASAVPMGLSITSMHYLAMLGTQFVPEDQTGRIFRSSFDAGQMHWPLAMGVLVFLYLLMEVSLRDTRQVIKKGISTRLRVIVITLVSVTGMSVGLLSVIEIDSILENHENEYLRLELEDEGEDFKQLISRLEDDIRFISKVPGISVLFKGLASNKSEVGGVPPEVVKKRVESLFHDFLAGKPEYLQLRLIGVSDGGRELIRTERQGDVVFKVPEQSLQSKSDEGYFTKTLALLPGVTYLSDIDFNREHGVVAEPRVMVIRIATPIYLDQQASPVGLVIINVNLTNVFASMIASDQLGDRDLVTDETGRLLTYRDTTLQKGESEASLFIQNRYPFLKKAYEKTPPEGYYTAKITDGGEQLYVHLQKISVSARYPGRELVQVEILPVAYIEQLLRPVLNQAFITTLLLILFSIPVALWLVRQIVQPLNRLIHAMEQFAAGDTTIHFPDSDLHEIHMLSSTFNEMREQVASREIALADAETRTRNVVEHVAEGIITIDEFGQIRSLNATAEKIFGYDDQTLIGENVSILIPEPYRSEHDYYIEQFRNGKGGDLIGKSRELKALHVDGHVFPIELTITIARQDNKKIFIGLIRDITERQLARQQERLASKVMETSLESIAITNAKNRIEYVNPAFCEISGYSFSEALGQNPSFLASGRHDGAFYKAMWESINSEGSWQGEIWDRRKDGTLYLKWLSITAIENSVGDITHYVGIASDITERKQSEERLKDLAHHDQLTGLPNRQLFNDRLELAIVQATRSKTQLALLFVDLDRFKSVNDTYGHDVGDKLLIEIAERIHGQVREGDTVARLGGDEFTLILPEIKEVGNAVHIAQEILECIDQPVVVGGHDCSVGASIGIAFFPQDGTDASTLLRHGDIAMYRAKSNSGSTYSLFDKEMEEAAARRLSIETRLRSAIENSQFFLNYQPVINGVSGETVGFEALIRWQVPGMGVVSPNEFIPLAEETGQIVEIGDWVLEAVCRQLVEWRSQGLKLLPVAVNISTRQLLERDFLGDIKHLLQRYEIDTDCLELELTETTLMKYPDECQSVLEACKALGLKIAIDDFGTGYSSLAYLKQLPLSKLKIDRAFIMHLEENPRSRAIIDSVVHLAQGLEMQVVAEGVETPGQLAILRELECGYLQGFLFSKPVSAEVAAEIMSDSRVYC
ncbi:MAG: EAL domain-containing protein [Sedimenticola sp.]|nr:EAL domain-containing protein [Sedimenticola sp.]